MGNSFLGIVHLWVLSFSTFSTDFNDASALKEGNNSTAANDADTDTNNNGNDDENSSRNLTFLLVLPAFSVMELDSDKIVSIILSRHSNKAPISKVLLSALDGEKVIVVTRDGACGTINRRVLHIVKVLIIIIVSVIVCGI